MVINTNLNIELFVRKACNANRKKLLIKIGTVERNVAYIAWV